MAIDVLYFAAVRDLVRRARESVDPAPATIGDLTRILEARYPGLSDARASIRYARNEAFADPGDPLADGDVVALLPPFAGG